MSGYPTDKDIQHEDNGAERGSPVIGNRRKGGTGEKIAVTLCGAAVLLALAGVNGAFSRGERAEAPEPSPAVPQKTIANFLGPAPSPPEKKEPEPVIIEEKTAAEEIIYTGELLAPPVHYPDFSVEEENKEPTPQERKRASGLMAYSAKTPDSGTNGVINVAVSDGGAGLLPGDRADGISADLKSAKLSGARAGLLVDRDMFITRGAFLDCALETAISSDVAGMTSCRLTRDVYGTSGRVRLLERGSRITGQYQSGLEQGKARIFVLWNRVETPHGVIVELDSPGTDALGRSGHTGYIDTHFWQRFGGAIMLSLIDDIGDYVTAKANEGNNDNINLGNSSDAAQNAAGVALESSIGIRPTLLKHQGEHISVFVARDLDFRGVYELKTSRR